MLIPAYLITFGLTLGLLNAHAAAPDGFSRSVAVLAQVQPGGDFAEVALTNPTRSPMICDSLDVSISVIRDESDLPMASLDLRFQHVFMNPGQTLTESNLGATELAALRTTDQSARLFKITTSLGDCKKAEWVDYCQYAEKSKDESYTIDVLNRAFGKNDCTDWRADQIYDVRLAYTEIKNLRPFAYFPNLQFLHLGSTLVESIEPLRSLKNLRKVCLADTPAVRKDFLSGVFSSHCY